MKLYSFKQKEISVNLFDRKLKNMRDLRWSGIEIEIRLLQPENAESPINATLVGIVIDSNLEQLENA